MLVLNDLWNSAVSPCERHYERGSAYDTVSRRISVQMDVLRQNASKRQRKLWEAYKERQLNISEFARVCNLSRTTVYKYIDLLEKR